MSATPKHYTVVYYAFFLRYRAGKPQVEAAAAARELCQQLLTRWRLSQAVPAPEELMEQGQVVCHLSAEGTAPGGCCSKVQVWLYTYHDAIVVIALAYDEQQPWQQVAEAFAQAGVALDQPAPGSIGTTVLYHAEVQDLERTAAWLDNPTGPLAHFGVGHFRHRGQTKAGLLALLADQRLRIGRRGGEAQELAGAARDVRPGWRALVLLTVPELGDVLNELFVRSVYADRLPAFVWAELARYKVQLACEDLQLAASKLEGAARQLEQRLVAWQTEERTALLEVARAGLSVRKSAAVIKRFVDDIGLHGRFVAVLGALQRQMETVEINVANYRRHSEELTGRPGTLLECDERWIERASEAVKAAARRFELWGQAGAQLIENIRAQLELITSHQQGRAAEAMDALTVVFAVIGTALGAGEIAGQLAPGEPLIVGACMFGAAALAWIIVALWQGKLR